MTRSPLVTVLASLPFILLANTSFNAQSPASSQHTLTFAERTYGATVTAMAPAPGGGSWFGGRTCSPSLPTTSDAVQPTKSSRCHGVIGRLTPGGALTYLSYLGGTEGDDQVLALTVDASGNVYAAGRTAAADFPTTADAYDRSCGDDGTCMAYRYDQGQYLYMPVSDGFVTKLSASGDRILYSTFLGGHDNDSITGLAVDASGRIHVAGATLSSDFPVTANALQLSYVGGSDPDGNPYDDAFYVRLAAGGASLQYGTYLGGSEEEGRASVAVDASGNAYVAGSTAARDFPVQNAAQPVNASAADYPNTTSDGFLVRFGDGAIYSTYVGGTQADVVWGVAAVDGSVYLAGQTCSPDFPGVSDPAAIECEAFISEGPSTTGAVGRTMTLHTAGGFDRAQALVVDAKHVAYITGVTVSRTNSGFPTTWDAFQRSYGGNTDTFLSIVDFGGVTPSLLYSTYLGGDDEEQGLAVTPDGSGGAFFGGYSHVFPGTTSSFPSHTSQLQPPPEPSPNEYQSFVGHVAAQAQVGTGGGAEVVLYARNATAIAGTWQFVADDTAAGGTRVWAPDNGALKLTTAAASPANYFELTFDAQAGVPYHLWLRMKADWDSWQNDSVFVQFSDSVDSSGNPAWRIGSTSATVVSLEDCSGCGEHGWGWNDNGYNTPGVPVTFATSGPHTVRIQQREDGISIDQIVLSSASYVTSAPGANKDDATILDATVSGSDSNEVVIYAADTSTVAGAWSLVDDTTAAAGKRLFNPDAGVPKLPTPGASPASYVEMTVTAQAGVPYHLWLRMRAQNDYWTNDSVFVQFSDSVDSSGNATWRIGSTSATVVSLEDCSGCGEQGWGWNDNGYATPGVLVTFASSGAHTIRIQQREDGISIDQIVLSAVKYLEQAPGAAKNDTTIVPK